MRRPFPRLPLAGLAAAAVAGIVLAEYSTLSAETLFPLAVAALMAAACFGRTGLTWLAAAAVFAAVHAWQSSEDPARAWAAALLREQPLTAKITGVVDTEPEEAGAAAGGARIWRALVRAESWEIGGRRIVFGTGVVVRWPATEPPRYGDRCEWQVVVSAIPPARNPHEFDAAAWWARRGVFLQARAAATEDVTLFERDRGSPVIAAALQARAWMLRTLGLGLEDAPGIRGLIVGTTLGARDTEAARYADAFRQTGTFHLFSVSGLHVGMFGFLLWLVLRPLGLSRRQAVLIVVPMLFFYALVTGAAPPSLRAATMISIALAGFLLDRPPSAANSLAAAALVLLGLDTNQLFSPGFQLSFSIVAAILVLARPLQEFAQRHLRPDPFLPRKLYTRRQRLAADAGRGLASALGVSGAAWLGSLPLTAAIFHLVPVLALPANLVAVPLAFAILAVSMLSLIAGLAGAWLSVVFNNTNWGLASLLLAAVEGTAALPGAYFHLPPGWMQPPARLTVFDLGTGGAQLLRTRTAAWLVDAGSASDFARAVEPALRASGVNHLDTLVLTHGDAEHIGGAAAALLAGPRRVLDSVLRDRSAARKSLHAGMAAQGVAKTLVLPGDIFAAGPPARIEVLWPGPRGTSRVADDQAMVLRVGVGPWRVLLMSDSGAATEAALLAKHGEDLASDILVLGRHGEDISATSAFLDAVRPRWIILAQPDPFRHGSDEPALRERLARSGAVVFDQAACGAVIVTFRGTRCEARGYLDGVSASLDARP